MKKVLGITLMVALLGLNAYIWPALIKSVSAGTKAAEPNIGPGPRVQATAAGTDFSNQDPKKAQVAFQPFANKENSASSTPAQAAGAGEQKQTAQSAAAKSPAKKASQTATARKKAQPKKQAAKKSPAPKEQTQQSPASSPDYNTPFYTDEGIYVVDYGSYQSNWVELSDGSIMRKSDGVRTFNMPFSKNIYTGEITPMVEPMSEAAYKMYQSQQAGFQPPVTTHYSNPR
ncbi:hypothetical protein [Brevibacillus borstelensis]|uniref:hypothetical protein n=1 Tax=Brevibacillus borstelensis TaxID=45462 RepID=UPI0030BFCA85